MTPFIAYLLSFGLLALFTLALWAYYEHELALLAEDLDFLCEDSLALLKAKEYLEDELHEAREINEDLTADLDIAQLTADRTMRDALGDWPVLPEDPDLQRYWNKALLKAIEERLKDRERARFPLFPVPPTNTPQETP